MLCTIRNMSSNLVKVTVWVDRCFFIYPSSKHFQTKISVNYQYVGCFEHYCFGCRFYTTWPGTVSDAPLWHPNDHASSHRYTDWISTDCNATTPRSLALVYSSARKHLIRNQKDSGSSAIRRTTRMIVDKYFLNHELITGRSRDESRAKTGRMLNYNTWGRSLGSSLLGRVSYLTV